MSPRYEMSHETDRLTYGFALYLIGFGYGLAQTTTTEKWWYFAAGVLLYGVNTFWPKKFE